jgi:putative restriction endonuclease
MKAYIGVTDKAWFDTLSNLPDIDEVNFWQPGGNRLFQSLQPGELFLFKLKEPLNFIVGGGIFAHSTILPVSLAWESFQMKNGAHSLLELRSRLERLRGGARPSNDDYKIGCVLLEKPFFFPREHWFVPPEWHPNIVQGKGYDLSSEIGRYLWRQLQERLAGKLFFQTRERETNDRFGPPVLIRPRLGQGSFRVVVTDVYSRRCAVTGERTLPVLEAAHIKPYAEGGEHEISNGILLRSDIHLLFDKHYVTVNQDLRFEVSRRIREEFENGRDYYKLHGTRLIMPEDPRDRPDKQQLLWHNDKLLT